MSAKLKVYELAKELGVDPQHLVDVVQRLGVDIKNSMSLLGTEEIRNIREHFRKNRPITKSVAAAAAPKPTTSKVTEKRVGATVIRRRAKKAEEVVEAEAPEVEPVVEAPSAAPVETALEVSAQASDSVEPEAVSEETAPAPEEVEAASPEVEAEPTTPVAAAPAGKPEEETKARRFFPSIIKKVSTESYLGEKVGPKVVRPKREETPKPPIPRTRTVVPGSPSAAGAAGAGTGASALKRVKEVEFVTATEAAKEAGRKRILERQNAVFKSSDYLKRELVHSTKKKKNAISRPAMKTVITTPAEHKRTVEMGATISVSDLAKEMGQKASGIISKLMQMGTTATINQSIDHDTAALVAQEFGYEVKQKVFKEADFVPTVDMGSDKLAPRGPVVTIMGHVDHGKTSLLDAIRKTNVAAGEAGGITQHIGAYLIEVPGKGKVTFIDTPGHEAFTAMRARGAKVTDIVVLVVSAIDGVMPQTLESIDHAKAANVPIVVAVNKCDLPDANPDRVKQTLAGHGLNPEEWGGDTIYVNVSAKTGKGIDTLLENLLLQAEVLDLKANYDIAARGTIVESRLDKNRGPVATVLVQHGTLKAGAIIVCGSEFGKIRAMNNDKGQRVEEALPGQPVEVLGFPAVPNVGDVMSVASDEKAAKALSSARGDIAKAQAAENAKPKMTLEEMLAGAGGTEKELRIILKADVQGSTEAIKEALRKFPTDKAKIRVLHASTGGVTESDVMLAAASRAVVIGFNIRPDVKAQKQAEASGVQIRTYTIIYDMLEEIKGLLEGLLDARVKEKVIGRAEVRNVFNVPKVGAVAGSAVIDGKVTRGCFLRLLRDNRVIYEGKLSSLRRFKDDVKEVAQGFECGIGIENFNDVKLGDQLEAFIKEETRDTLS